MSCSSAPGTLPDPFSRKPSCATSPLINLWPILREQNPDRNWILSHSRCWPKTGMMCWLCALRAFRSFKGPMPQHWISSLPSAIRRQTRNAPRGRVKPLMRTGAYQTQLRLKVVMRKKS
ncbi:UNVERIFIED_CONTAM: hypothetical protein GTU68_064492 [Idotea baltica]|nr:hypothetical protein [Idotea baltica]